MNAASIMSECPIAQINEDDEEVQDRTGIELQGYLNKWTNFLHGWQKRYFVLKNGTLLYFKSQSETECGCRGAISLLKANVKVQEDITLTFKLYKYPTGYRCFNVVIYVGS